VVVGLEVNAANEFVGLPAGEAKLVVEHTTTDDLVATRQPSAHKPNPTNLKSEGRLTTCDRLCPIWSNRTIVVEYRNCL
jgi:hypothetical protein